MDGNTNSCYIFDVAVYMLAQRLPIVCNWQRKLRIASTAVKDQF